MSYLSGYQLSNQSLNGIISLSDGSGSQLENGNLTLTGNLITNNYAVSNNQLSYLYNCSSNIQEQINAIYNYINLIYTNGYINQFSATYSGYINQYQFAYGSEALINQF
jgi:hypothetical protein